MIYLYTMMKTLTNKITTETSTVPFHTKVMFQRQNLVTNLSNKVSSHLNP